MLISDEILTHRSEFLAMERTASQAYLEFVYDDAAEADLVRERMFDAGVSEFSPTFGRILLAHEQALGMISCLPGREVAHCRMRSALFLARSGLLEEKSQTRHRMESAARTLIKLQPDDFYLSRIAVRSSADSVGVADELMRFCEKEARQLGSTRICLEVSEKNERALRFYKRWSFFQQDIRSTVEAGGRGLTYIHMVKSLS